MGSTQSRMVFQQIVESATQHQELLIILEGKKLANFSDIALLIILHSTSLNPFRFLCVNHQLSFPSFHPSFSPF